MMIEQQSQRSASPTSAALNNSGGERIMNTVGMTTFTLRHCETGETAEYMALDLRCAQMLAAADHSDDDEDYEAWEWVD